MPLKDALDERPILDVILDDQDSCHTVSRF
jgi:hypothetical protein